MLPWEIVGIERASEAQSRSVHLINPIWHYELWLSVIPAQHMDMIVKIRELQEMYAIGRWGDRMCSVGR